MTLTTALLTMLPSNAATLALGYFWGRKVRAVVQMGETVRSEDPTSAQRYIAPKWMHLLSVVVAGVGVLTVLLGVLIVRSESRQERLIACVTDYSNDAAAAARARGMATVAVFDEIDAVFAQVNKAFDADPAAGRKQVRQAIEHYNEARAHAKQTQRANPVPDAPENACAELN